MSEHSNLLSLVTASFGHEVEPSVGARMASVDAAAWSVVANHLLELRAAEVIDDAAIAAVALALQAASSTSVGAGGPRETVMALIHRVESRVPASSAGVLTLGLAVEEVLATVGRLRWRGVVLAVLGATLDVSFAVQRLAETHVVTIMPAYLGGQPVQPTTLAHFLGGVIEPLLDGRRRLREAYAVVNRSPLGAGLLTGDVVAADRNELAVRLGFETPIPNTLVALGETGDPVEAVEAMSAVLAALDRFVRELQLWIRTDPTSFVLDEPWLGSPEAAHPALTLGYRLDALHLGLAAALDRLDGIRQQLRRLGYGPVGAGQDVIINLAGEVGEVISPLLAESKDLFTTGIVVNRAYLGNRAGRFHTTAPDLATFLMTEENLPPTIARQIAVLVLARVKDMRLEVSGITPDMIDSAALMTIGRELKVEMETLGRFLAPRRYIERRQVLGAAAPDMVRVWLEERDDRLNEDRLWLETSRRAVERAISGLSDAIAAAAEISLDD